MSEPKFSTSFIPKKSLQDSIVSQPSSQNRFVARSEMRGPMYALTLTIFIIALAVSLGLFAYTRAIDASVKQKLADVKRIRVELTGEVVSSIIRLNDRITIASSLLKEHSALSHIFPFLEGATLQNGVTYTSVSFQKDTKNNAQAMPILSLSGTATSLELVVLQLQAFQESPKVVSAHLRDVGRDQEKKKVTFSIELTMKPDAFVFKEERDSQILPSSTSSATIVPQTSTSTLATTTPSTLVGTSTQELPATTTLQKTGTSSSIKIP